MQIVKKTQFSLAIYEGEGVSRNYVKVFGNNNDGEFTDLPEGVTVQVVQVVPNGDIVYTISEDVILIDSSGNTWLEVN